MPAAYTHYRFGRDVLPLLPPETRQIIAANRALYDLGLHGPDIFFFYRQPFDNAVARLGHTLHGQSGGAVLRRMAALWEKNPTDAGLSYLYGFLCHFALDSACHGYVGQMEQVGVGHSILETQLDRSYLVDDRLDPTQVNPVGHLKPTPEAARTIAAFFPQVTEREVEESCRTMIKVQRLLLPTSGAKRKLLQGSTRLLKLDFVAGMVMPERESVACRQMVAYLRALYQEALPAAASLIQAFPRLESDQYKLNFEGETAEEAAV